MVNTDVRKLSKRIVKNPVRNHKKETVETAHSSALQLLLRKFPDMVLHYPADEWSNSVWREYNIPYDE